MSISTTINRWSYVGNGVTTAFAYTNKILASTDLKVYLETIADGTLTLQTETTHYTVSGAGEAAGGNVTFLTPPSSAYNVVIVREVPYTQPAEFDPRKQQSPSGTEDAFDRATILVQQVLDRLSRTIGLATGKSSPASLDGLTGDLASKYLGFDADEQPVALDAPADTTAVSAYMAALLLTASEAAFKAAANLEAGVDFLAYSTRVNNLDQDFVDVASATTTDIGAAASRNVRITGTTTITGLGTVAAGIARLVRFAGALTLTHNGTSLILPGGANIATAANDAARFVSLGSGNWICTRYQRAAGLGVAHPAFRATQASAQILTAATYVKIQFGTETYDTHAYYDNATNYRYTPLVAGKYQVNAAIAANITKAETLRLALYKNGSAIMERTIEHTGAGADADMTLSLSDLVDMNGSTDYLEVFVRSSDATPSTLVADATKNVFSAARVA